MNHLFPQQNEEKIKFTDVIPAIGLSTMFFFIIQAFYSSNYDELQHLRDQSWKIINIEMIPPYHYEITKMKHEHSLNLYDGSSEIYSTTCGYSTIQLCKDEFPVASGKIKNIEFYKSSNKHENNLSTVLRIKSIQYENQNNQLETISLKESFPNTTLAITKQKWKLGFCTFIATWFFLFLVYLTSIFTIAPLFVRKLMYIFLAGNMVFIILKTLMILI